MEFPEPVWRIIQDYKKEMERIDKFNNFLVTVFENLIAVMRSK